MTGKATLITTINSSLGDTLFPNEDFYSRELNNLVGEVIQECCRLGKDLTLSGIGETLAVMTPQFLLDSAWDNRDKERWETELKPRLISAIDDFFIGGGIEARSEEIANLLTSLRKLGVDITEVEKLKASLIVGDWRKRLIVWAEMGRPEGVIFVAHSDTSLDAVTALLQEYQFSKDAINRFTDSFRF